MRFGIFTFGQHSTPWHAKREKSALGQGSHLIRHVCQEAGFEVADLCARWETVDVLMVTLYWWEHVYDLVADLAKKGVEYDRRKRKGKPLIFVGGQLPSYNPAPLREIADIVCVGDGEEVAPRVLGELQKGAEPKDLVGIPGVYVSEVDNKATWQQVDDISATLRFPFVNQALITAPSGVKERKTWERRIEVARGCRCKCLFCGVGWTKKYREQPTEDVIRELEATPGCVKTFAPDLRAHSGWGDIMEAYRRSNRVNQARDLSTKVILKEGFGVSRSYSTGIDGLSQRIRGALAKPLTRENLIKILVAANGHMGSLGLYMILDLPGETEADVTEWFETLLEASKQLKPTRELTKQDISRGFSADRFYAIVTLNAFCPTPHTPLQWAGINWRDDLTEKYMGQIDILGDPDSRHLKHKLLGRAHKGTSRILESAVLRGGPELAPFIFAAAANRKMWSPYNALQVARRLGVRDRLEWTMAEKSVDETLPWAERVEGQFPQSALAKGWARYRRRMGID